MSQYIPFHNTCCVCSDTLRIYFVLCNQIKKLHGLYDLFQNSSQRDIKFRPVLFLTFHFVLMDVKIKQYK